MLDIPEHLPSSPLCPMNPKHDGGGRSICPYHGRMKGGGVVDGAGDWGGGGGNGVMGMANIVVDVGAGKGVGKMKVSGNGGQ